MQLIRPIRAELAQATDARNPLDARTITHLPPVVHGISDGNDGASTFMPSYALGGLLHGQAEAGPFVVQERLVAGTEAGPVDLDEDLVGLWLGHIDLGQGCRSRIAAADPHGRILLGGDVNACHC